MCVPWREAERSRLRSRRAGTELTDSPTETVEGSADVTGSQTSGDHFGGPVTRGRGCRATVPLAVYTGVQMLKFRRKSLTLSHDLDRPARLRGGRARSARHCNIMRSDMSGARPAIPWGPWDRCTESPTSTYADCSLPQEERTVASGGLDVDLHWPLHPQQSVLNTQRSVDRSGSRDGPTARGGRGGPVPSALRTHHSALTTGHRARRVSVVSTTQGRSNPRRVTHVEIRFQPRPCTVVDRRSKKVPKTATSAILGHARRDDQVPKPDRQVVSCEADRISCGCSWRSESLVGIGAPNLPHRFPRHVHYLRLKSRTQMARPRSRQRDVRRSRSKCGNGNILEDGPCLTGGRGRFYDEATFLLDEFSQGDSSCPGEPGEAC
jgi:hypothetical protein